MVGATVILKIVIRLAFIYNFQSLKNKIIDSGSLKKKKKKNSMRTSPVYKAETQLLMIKVAQLQLILCNLFSCKRHGANGKRMRLEALVGTFD